MADDINTNSQETINLLLETHLDSISREFRSSMAEIRDAQNRIEKDLGNDLRGVAKELRESQDRIERDTIIRLERIETQTTLTNGRVSELEKWEIEEKAKDALRHSDKSWVQPVVTGFTTAILIALVLAGLGSAGII